MAKFEVLAKSPDGRTLKSIREGADTRAIANIIKAEGLQPVSIKPVKAGSLKASHERKRRGKGGQPGLKDIASFIRQISVMLKAGIGLVTILEDLAEQEDKISFAKVIEEIRNKLSSGSLLSVAMRDYPKVFSPLLCAMIRAGEETGNLDSVTVDLAEYLEGQLALRRTIKSALTYPVFVLIIFIGAMAFMFLYLIPKFKGVFASLGAKLPPLTDLALNMSKYLWKGLPFIIIFTVGGIIGYKIMNKNPAGKHMIDSFKLKLPLFGSLIMKIILARFLDTLATLQRSGVPILAALEIAQETIGNAVIEGHILKARNGLMQGSFLSKELDNAKIFPRMMVRMVAIGEETGRTDELLAQTAYVYRDEAEKSIEGMTSLIEPAIMIGMGGIVAFVVLAVYMPIFKMAGAMGG